MSGCCAGRDPVIRGRALALLVVAAVTVAGCAGDEEATPTVVSPPAPPAATTPSPAGPPSAGPPSLPPATRATAPPPSPLPEIGLRLQAAGFQIVRQPLPAGVSGVESAFLTGAGPVSVYVFAFGAIDPAAAYARTVAAQARRSGGNVLGRRVDEIVYVGNATNARGRRELAPQLERVVKVGRQPQPQPQPPPAASPPPAPPPAPVVSETVQGRLQAAGFRVVRQPRPKGVPGVVESLVTGAGPIVVYIYAFEAIDPARAYAARIAAQAGRSRGRLLGRRVGETVYVGTATDARGRRQLRSQLQRVVKADDG